jgi:glycerol uptake facilitator-like aquaporin
MTPLARRLVAEFLGTGMLVTAVVGSGVAAQRLSPDDTGLQLLENAAATALALGVLIVVFTPVSGAHLNPAITLADWWLHRQDRSGPPFREALGYIGAQHVGAISGAVLANAMYALAPATWSTTSRTGGHVWLGEVVATAGLVLLVFALQRTARTSLAPASVAAYIGAAYWFTSSTSFANPAVTLARAFTDTLSGIAPASVPGFLTAQLVGASIGLAVLAAIYPIHVEAGAPWAASGSHPPSDPALPTASPRAPRIATAGLGRGTQSEPATAEPGTDRA